MRLRIQSIANAWFCEQKSRLGWVQFDLLPQTMHELLQELPLRVVAIAPHVGSEPFRSDDVSRIGQ